MEKIERIITIMHDDTDRCALMYYRSCFSVIKHLKGSEPEWTNPQNSDEPPQHESILKNYCVTKGKFREF